MAGVREQPRDECEVNAWCGRPAGGAGGGQPASRAKMENLNNVSDTFLLVAL
jgi:hypothetical protein